jgi:tRNA pseudouridine55 synthase
VTDDAFVLPVDKPEGPTSHDVVARARRALGTRKIGHTGTLDPFASGLLVLCVGRATRLAEYLTGLPKSYVAEARLGVETDTLDREGRVVSETDGWEGLTREEIESAAAELVGEIEQVPPQFSAKKVGGEAMHRKARRGEVVELASVPVTIHALDVEEVYLPTVTFAVRCSSGTYVRALARDLGERLAVGAHLTGLRRTSVGDHDVGRAVSLDDLDTPGVVARARMSPVEALGHLPRIEVDAEAARRIRHGQRIRVDELPPGADGVRSGARAPTAEPIDAGEEPVGAAAGSVDTAAAEPIVVTCGADLVAVARLDAGVLKPRKVFPA